MIVNEKALLRQMKEAYKTSGYTVLVAGDDMVINSGFWLVQIDIDNVPNEILALIALHMRKIPANGDAYKISKGDDGPIVQKKLLEDALGPVSQMESLREGAIEDGGLEQMVKTNLRYDNCNLWQSAADLSVFLIDPRFEALIADKKAVSMVGEGIYAEGEISKVWVLRVQKKDEPAQLKHLSGIRWVAE